MTLSFDTSLLSAYYNARSGVSGSSASASNAAAQKYAPTAPWSPNAKASSANNETLMPAAVKSVMTGGKLVDENAAQLDLPGASGDYRKLFALYNALNTLAGVADQMKGKGLTSTDQDLIRKRFASGVAEINAYVDTLQLDKIRVTRGDVASSEKTGIPVSRRLDAYTTPPLVSGNVTNPVDALQGDVRFNISIQRAGATHNIPIDLSEMGSTPRTLGNVVNYINDKLTTEGVGTRVATLRIPGGDRTVTVNGKPVKIGTNPDSWALSVKVDAGDTVSFQPAATEPAVYLAQSVGDPNPDHDPTTKDSRASGQLLKFQTDTASVDAPPQGANEANWVDGRVWARDLDPKVGAVHATQVGPDGSVYVLADVTGKVDGQDIKGTQDVALVKYDSAGKLLYTRTLGAGGTASGLALAVSDNGDVAVAGRVTGGLNGATNGALNSGDTGSFAANSDSFVTVFNSEGEEQWTQRRGVRANDEATNIAFGADGSVYVAGRSQTPMPGSTGLGGWDGYVEGFKADASGKVSTLFTQSVGSAGTDRPAGMVVDGSSLVIASNEDGRAVLHRLDVSGGTPVETGRRDLGDLQGGEIAGLALNGGQVVVAGTTSNGALAAGSVSSAISGGRDGFVAQISADLSSSGSDSVAYYGGSGDDKVTGLAVSNGQVFISGQTSADLPGQPAVGKQDGFVARIDVSTGSVDWSRRFTGKDGFAAPTTLAVDAMGSSALDRLGLPQGELDMTGSQQLTALSSLRAGDQFQVRSSLTGVKHTITIDVHETLDTLSTKLRRALDYQAEVKTVTVNGLRSLSIAPLAGRDTLELFSGPAGKDALSALGLSEGIIRSTVVDKNGKSQPADGKGQIYGLKLDPKMNLADATALSHVDAVLAAARGAVRTAYNDLKTAATPQSILNAQKAQAASGSVPTYLTNQIANYQQALARLGG